MLMLLVVGYGEFDWRIQLCEIQLLNGAVCGTLLVSQHPAVAIGKTIDRDLPRHAIMYINYTSLWPSKNDPDRAIRCARYNENRCGHDICVLGPVFDEDFKSAIRFERNRSWRFHI